MSDHERALELFARVPDEEARSELVEIYTPLARYLANRYRGRGQEASDLIQVAYLGLLNAIDRFDLSYGTAFVSFAVPTITGEIKRHFRDRSWGMGVPRPVKDLSMLVRTASEELTQQLGRSPTLEEVAQHLGVSEEEVFQAAALGNAYRPDALDASLVPDEEKPELTDTLGGEDPRFELIENLDALRPALDRLPERERSILHLAFYEELSQREIARQLGISQMHVSRLLKRCLDRLRHLIAA